MGGAGFLGFMVVGSILILNWVPAIGRGEIKNSIAPATWEIIGVGLAFTAQTLAAGLYSVYAYGRWLARSIPPPIFWNETRLLALVEPAIKTRLELETNWGQSTVTKIVEVNRTTQAGLSIRLRAETATDKIFEGHFLTAVQHWRIISDRWGHIRQFDQAGPLEYIPDPERVYAPSGSGASYRGLEGELIFPKKRAKPTLDEAILAAITTSSDH